MERNRKRKLAISIGLLAMFLLWTTAVSFVDVQAIGPCGSSVGFASINRLVHRMTGVHLDLYTLTDWLSLVPVGLCVGFGILGLGQWILRKGLRKVDFSILVLGGFYVVTVAVFLLFEIVPVNDRPILIEGKPEASYPSSTTLLVMCVIPTSVMQLNSRIRNRLFKNLISAVLMGFMVFMVIGRLVSGVHWLTDIIGGALLSGGLVMLYHCISTRPSHHCPS